MRIDLAATFLTGCVVVAAVHTTFGWWLDSGTGVGAMLVALTLIAWIVGRGSPDRLRTRTIGLWSGAMVASTTIMFVIGPGTLWPLATVIAAVLIAAGVMAGFVIAWFLRPDRDRASPTARTRRTR